MTRLPWDPAELGTHDDDLDQVAERLTRHAEAESAMPPAALVDRIQAALDDEPIPAAAWWRGGLMAWRGPVQVLAAAAVLVLGVVAGLALGQLSSLVEDGGTGSSPAPITSPSQTPSPTLSPSPSDSASPSPSPSATESPLSSARLITPEPTVEVETPDPDEDSGGNSGPGGGGGDNSGPGGGGD